MSTGWIQEGMQLKILVPGSKSSESHSLGPAFVVG